MFSCKIDERTKKRSAHAQLLLLQEELDMCSVFDYGLAAPGLKRSRSSGDLDYCTRVRVRVRDRQKDQVQNKTPFSYYITPDCRQHLFAPHSALLLNSNRRSRRVGRLPVLILTAHREVCGVE